MWLSKNISLALLLIGCAVVIKAEYEVKFVSTNASSIPANMSHFVSLNNATNSADILSTFGNETFRVAFSIGKVFKAQFVRPNLTCIGDVQSRVNFKFAINTCYVDFEWSYFGFKIARTMIYETQTDVEAFFNGNNLNCTSKDLKFENYTLPCEMAPDSTPKEAKFPYFATLSLKQPAKNISNVSCQVLMKIFTSDARVITFEKFDPVVEKSDDAENFIFQHYGIYFIVAIFAFSLLCGGVVTWRVISKRRKEKGRTNTPDVVLDRVVVIPKPLPNLKNLESPPRLPVKSGLLKSKEAGKTTQVVSPSIDKKQQKEKKVVKKGGPRLRQRDLLPTQTLSEETFPKTKTTTENATEVSKDLTSLDTTQATGTTIDTAHTTDNRTTEGTTTEVTTPTVEQTTTVDATTEVTATVEQSIELETKDSNKSSEADKGKRKNNKKGKATKK